MNIKESKPEDTLSRIFRAISSPARVQILAAIGSDEACVCHLESVLDLRQAYISQQLMEMRDADLVETRREGRYIFYRLTEPQLLDLIFDIGSLFGIPSEKMESLRKTNPLSECCCPDCTAHRNPTVLSKGEIQSLLKEK